MAVTMAAEHKSTPRRYARLALLALCALFLVAVALGIAWNIYRVRAAIRWSCWSRDYKAAVLAQPASANGMFKHIEWDGWGWAGQDTTVYLVFDPTDSLSAAGKGHHNKFNGLPCEVAMLTRLENNWYTVQFYTNEFWGRRDELDCRGSAQ
jgi:hypothetical protein